MDESIETFVEKLTLELESKNAVAISPDEEFRQLAEWNSMNALIILSFINVEYGKPFTSQQLTACKTFRNIYEILKTS